MDELNESSPELNTPAVNEHSATPVSETPAAPALPAVPAATQPVPARSAVSVDETKAVSGYANFCRVTATPEEVVLDFGLNTQPMAVPTEPIAVQQRVVTNYFTAKRLVQALIVTLQRHEAAFGPIETDVHRRAQGARPSAPRSV